MNSSRLYLLKLRYSLRSELPDSDMSSRMAIYCFCFAGQGRVVDTFFLSNKSTPVLFNMSSRSDNHLVNQRLYIAIMGFNPQFLSPPQPNTPGPNTTAPNTSQLTPKPDTPQPDTPEPDTPEPNIPEPDTMAKDYDVQEILAELKVKGNVSPTSKPQILECYADCRLGS